MTFPRDGWACRFLNETGKAAVSPPSEKLRLSSAKSCDVIPPFASLS